MDSCLRPRLASRQGTVIKGPDSSHNPEICGFTDGQFHQTASSLTQDSCQVFAQTQTSNHPPTHTDHQQLLTQFKKTVLTNLSKLLTALTSNWANNNNQNNGTAAKPELHIFSLPASSARQPAHHIYWPLPGVRYPAVYMPGTKMTSHFLRGRTACASQSDFTALSLQETLL